VSMFGLDFAALVAAGFLATLGMTLAGYLLGAGGLTYFDLDLLLVSRIDPRQSAPGIGLVIHFLIGIGLAAFYILLWHPAGDTNLLSGMLYGVGLWAIAMVVVLPLAGRRVFAVDLGWRRSAALLASHLVYGAAIAGLYPLLSSA